MLQTLVRNWWVVLLRGLVAIVFGVLAFAWPGLTLVSLVALFAIYCVIDGIVALAAALGGDEAGRPWSQMILAGIVSIAAGVAAFLWPGLTAMVLLWIVAAWAVVRGLFEIVAAVRLRRVIANEWMLILAGFVSILFGVALFARPGAGAVAVVWFIGAFAIVHGVLLAVLAFRLRSMRDLVNPGPIWAA